MRLTPFAARQSAKRAINSTPAVLSLIGLLIAVHVASLVDWAPLNAALVAMAFLPPLFLQMLFNVGEWLAEFGGLSGLEYLLPLLVLVSPLTHALLHADIMHLLVNCAFLLAFGTEIDRRVGSRRMLGLAALGALGGALAVLAVFFVTGIPHIVVGASGAVSALLGALVRPMPQRRTTFVVVFVAINIVLGFTGFPGSHGVQGIAWDAHIGGFFTGFLLYPLFQRPQRYA